MNFNLILQPAVCRLSWLPVTGPVVYRTLRPVSALSVCSVMSGPRSALLAGRPQPPMLCSSSWRCQAELASVLKLSAADCPAQNDEETPSREHCVLLELPTPSKGDNSCTLSLLCAAQGKDRILGITIHSEARTIEIYSALQNGKEEEYLGTSRGERFCTLESSGEESPAVLYKAHLKFEFPVPSCIV
ncbi:unnamed protein product [Ranitomeya imitator]|uniref:Recombination activating protein 2 n=1 Tax=Ranitomeya imitator TaxID=111125 RepID=A0ABN9MBY8_9NEOB|nr:unnamed protein product [Ranitomeya imitator]